MTDPPPGWEDPPRRPAAPGDAPVLSVDGFEGPLDWLLELARARRIDLARLSIAALVGAFADALAAALSGAGTRPLTLARWGGWLVMAADLALLRSRLTVPEDAAERPDAETEAEALRARLLARAAAAAAADWLDRRAQLGRDAFGRGRADAAAVAGPARLMDVTALLRACLAALLVPGATDAAFRVQPPFWSTADAVARIRSMVAGAEAAPLERFLPGVPCGPGRELRCREAVASTFGGVLELARGGAVAVDQDGAWAPVRVGRPAPDP